MVPAGAVGVDPPDTEVLLPPIDLISILNACEVSSDTNVPVGAAPPVPVGAAPPATPVVGEVVAVVVAAVDEAAAELLAEAEAEAQTT